MIKFYCSFKKQNNAEFNDWIIALQWISVEKQLQLAILFAHNYISIYDISENSSQIIYCEEKCILYPFMTVNQLIAKISPKKLIITLIDT